MSRLALCIIALSVALAGGAIRAQSTGNPSAAPQQSAPGNAGIGTATISPTGIPPSQRNPLLTDSGDVRISKMIGTTIYNRNDQKVGSVDDVVAGPNGQLQVIVATNDKKVAVPWDKVQFGDAKLNSHNKLLMLDTTQKDLNSMSTFAYQKH